MIYKTYTIYRIIVRYSIQWGRNWVWLHLLYQVPFRLKRVFAVFYCLLCYVPQSTIHVIIINNISTAYQWLMQKLKWSIWVIICGWLYVGDYMWVIICGCYMWVIICGWLYGGDYMWVIICGPCVWLYVSDNMWSICVIICGWLYVVHMCDYMWVRWWCFFFRLVLIVMLFLSSNDQSYM